jgi:hypothetical protein
MPKQPLSAGYISIPSGEEIFSSYSFEIDFYFQIAPDKTNPSLPKNGAGS